MRRLFCAIALGMTTALTFAAPALAGTTLSSSSRYATVTVEVDDALKSYPKLSEYLAAQGKVWGTKAREEAAREIPKLPKSAPSGAWQYKRNYKLYSAIGPYVSVVFEDFTDTHGAHPNNSTDTVLWDREAEKPTNVRPLFNEAEDGGPTMTELAKLVRAALVTEKRRRGEPVKGDPEKDFWLQNVKPWLEKLGAIALAPSTVQGKSSGLTFIFSPYLVGPYVDGTITVFVPWTDLKEHLSPQGAALFGGVRPAGNNQRP
jgi:hypothetical protein